MNPDSRITLTTWYVNPHRVQALIGTLPPLFMPRLPYEEHDHFVRMRLFAQVSEGIVLWLQSNKVPALEALVAHDDLARGKLFTYEGRFYSKGLAGASQSARDVLLRASMKDYGSAKELRVLFNSDGLTTQSAWGRLRGNPSIFVLAYIEDITENAIIARPYVVADLVEQFGTGIEIRLREQLERHPSAFDQLSHIDFSRVVSRSDLERLRGVPEKEVKGVIANLIGEAFIPKDWGGEECDLFSANVLVDGEPRTCAFAFKGPSKFAPLKIKDCGKNGDQLLRLFETGAEISVLQHCHTVTPAVRKTMAAHARSDFSQKRYYAVFDGYTTYQILDQTGALS